MIETVPFGSALNHCQIVWDVVEAANLLTAQYTCGTLEDIDCLCSLGRLQVPRHAATSEKDISYLITNQEKSQSGRIRREQLSTLSYPCLSIAPVVTFILIKGRKIESHLCLLNAIMINSDLNYFFSSVFFIFS